MNTDKKKDPVADPAQQDAIASLAKAPVMYIGPSLSRPFPLSRGDVFAGGLPALLHKAVKEDAALAALFLPIREAGQALREIERGSGSLAEKLAKHAKTVAAKYAARRQ